MHSFCKYLKQVVYVVTTVLRRVARIKKTVSRTECGTFFMSVVLLVSSSTGTQMSIKCAVVGIYLKFILEYYKFPERKFFFCIGYVTFK
jgi:hypothetical protein